MAHASHSYASSPTRSSFAWKAERQSSSVVTGGGGGGGAFDRAARIASAGVGSGGFSWIGIESERSRKGSRAHEMRRQRMHTTVERSSPPKISSMIVGGSGFFGAGVGAGRAGGPRAAAAAVCAAAAAAAAPPAGAPKTRERGRRTPPPRRRHPPPPPPRRPLVCAFLAAAAAAGVGIGRGLAACGPRRPAQAKQFLRAQRVEKEAQHLLRVLLRAALERSLRLDTSCSTCVGATASRASRPLGPPISRASRRIAAVSAPSAGAAGSQRKPPRGRVARRAWRTELRKHVVAEAAQAAHHRLLRPALAELR